MFARTDRLLLRPAWAEDARALHAMIADQAIVRNLATAPWPYRLEDAEAFVAAEPAPSDARFLLFRRTRGAPQLIGSAGLGRHPEDGVELGYWIGRPFWGLGYATEAAAAIVEIARDSLRIDTLFAGHFVDNPASGRVLEKVGFRPSGEVRPRYSVGRGGMADCVGYRLDLASPDALPRPRSAMEKAFCIAA